jgi:hypothetical protein
MNTQTSDSRQYFRINAVSTSKDLTELKSLFLTTIPKGLAVVLIFILNFSFLTSYAITKTSTGSTNWGTASTWSPSGVPAAGDDVVIANGHTVTVNVAAVCSTLTINNGNSASQVTISGTNSLTISGAVTINAGSGSGDHKLIAVGTGTLSCASVTVAATGSSSRNSGITLSTGTVSVTGNITMADANDVVTFTGAGILNLGGSMTGGTFTQSTGSVNYNGTAQSIRSATYYNLTLSGSGIKTAAGALTVSNSTTLAGVTYKSGTTTGYSSTLGILSMSSGSTIALGTGSHTLTFSNSTASAWTGTLSITGWSTGTSGKIQFGVDGLTDSQLGQVSFTGFSTGGVITSSGELIPRFNWQAKFISMDFGSASWCAGETRTVTVTVKNVGTSTWTDVSPDINIGIKWNADADYFVRTDAGGLAPGATQSYSLTVTAPATGGANNLTFDVVNEQTCWFANNSGTCGPGNSVFTSASLTITVPPVATSATNLMVSSFSANWGTSTGATGYRLDVSTVSNFASFLTGYEDLDVSNVTTYPVTGITYGTTYYYRVRAYTANCTGLNSNTITVVTVSNGDYRSNAAAMNWNTTTSGQWQKYNGTTWQNTTTPPTSSNATIITIQNGHNVTVTASVSVDQVTIASGGKVTVNSGITLTIANGTEAYDMEVAGVLLNNSGTITTTGALKILDGGKYQHGYTTTQGTIPTANWNSGSICEIVGYTTNTNAPAGLGQAFYHFIWNCAGQTANLNLAGGLTTVNGDFTVLATNTGQLRLTSTTALTLTVGGDLKINSGTLDFASGAATTKIFNLGGNYNQTGGTFTNSNSNILSFNFTGINKTFVQSAGTLTNTYINWTINSGASLALNNNLPVASSRSCTVNGTLDCGVSTAVTGAGTFTLANGGTLVIGSPVGITASGATGNIQVTGSRTFNTGSNYTYDNSSTQVSGNGLPSTVNTLTVAGSNPLTLTNSTTSASPFTATNFTISSGKFELGSSQYMTVSGTTTLSGAECLVLKSSSTGTASFVDNGISGTGTALAERYIANDWKWHFLSSPVAAQPIWPEFAPTPTGSPLSFGSQPWNWDFYYWNPNASLTTGLYWVNIRKSNGAYNDANVDQGGSYAGFGSSTPAEFTVGRGYLVSYNSGWTSGSPDIHSFSGNLNSGSISRAVTIGANNFNLVGNPYASPIDWKASGWSRTDLELNGSGYDYWIFNDNTGNYGVFNSAGATGTNGTSQYIAQEQSFFVKVAADGTLGMTNTIRKHSTQSWLKEGETENNTIHLKLTSDANTYNDELIIQIDPSISAGGSEKFWSLYVEAPEIYSEKDGNNYSIDRYNALEEDLNIQVNTKIGTEGIHTLTATNLGDFTLSSRVLLEDLKTGTITNLKQTPSYSFNGSPADDRNRFRLLIGSPTGIKEQPTSTFNIYAFNKAIIINNTQLSQPYQVIVTNMIGQVIDNSKIVDSGVTRIELNPMPGIYVITVISEGKTISKKVIIS